MANETTIKIKASADGSSYTMEIVEAEAQNGTRIDQVTARAIIQTDEKLKDPRFEQMYQQMQNQQNQARRGMSMPMGGFPPGGMFPPSGGNMGFPGGGMMF